MIQWMLDFKSIPRCSRAYQLNVLLISFEGIQTIQMIRNDIATQSATPHKSLTGQSRSEPQGGRTNARWHDIYARTLITAGHAD